MSGLDGISASSITTLLVFDNYSLSTCEVQSICDYLEAPGGMVSIYNNATGCNSPAEVMEACNAAYGCLAGGITFSTQAEIDQFQTNYPGCTEIQGDVTINGNNICNLDGLESVTFIGGNLSIICNYSLSDIDGLGNLTSIGGILQLSDNPSLTSLTAFANLASTGSLLISDNVALVSMAGFESLTSISGWLSISGTDLMNNLMGLENLSTVGGTLYLGENNALTSLYGLNNLSAIGGSLDINENPALASLMGLEHLSNVEGEILIAGNTALTSLSGIDQIGAGSIAGITIHDNPLLTACDVQSICEYLASPGGSVSIYGNAPGCNSPGEVESACLNVGIPEIAGKGCVRILPNPAADHIYIETSGLPAVGHFSISNSGGQLMPGSAFSRTPLRIDIRNWPSGIYIVKVYGDDYLLVGKFVKQ